MAVENVTTALDRAGIGYELLEHRHTESGMAEAYVLGVSAADVGKTVILDAPSGRVRAVIPASERVDLGKMADTLDENRHRIHLMSEERLAQEYPEFELGAVPPFAGSRDERVVLDSRLAGRYTVVSEAGSHEHSLRLAVSDLIRLTAAETADICREE